jgi:hypothetical protein
MYGILCSAGIDTTVPLGILCPRNSFWVAGENFKIFLSDICKKINYYYYYYYYYY